ncbi:MAG TPA: hypothetical protein DCZ72_08700 [Armatimonadetes bacterium]|nr:hypothetical protein [Armatimonadota bacterium]
MSNIRRRGYLPHIESPGRSYLLTFRLQERGDAWLRQPEVASQIEGILLFRHRMDYSVYAWCIMPDHVHLVLLPLQGRKLPAILHRIKGFSARRCNALLGREGIFWQQETHDSLLYSDRDREAAVEYVVTNPVRAGLCQRVDHWRWSSAGYRAQMSAGLLGPWQWP